VLDDSVKRNTDDCATCTTTSENNAVGQAASTKEVLCRSNSNGLVELSVMQD
jgi:hypothetical protein